MPWHTPVVTLDADKPFVGSVHFEFVDTDSTVFMFDQRAEGRTTAQADALWAQAIAARDAWRQQKTRQANIAAGLVARIPSGETIG